MREIKLIQGKVALVDDEDFDFISQFKWCAFCNHGKTFYAVRRGENKTILMHRVILEALPGEDVDHIDGDGLNNQRANIRRCTRSENNMNRRSKQSLKGITWDKTNKKWRAKIKINRKAQCLGRYVAKEEAARAYDLAAKEIFGEFARTNF